MSFNGLTWKKNKVTPIDFSKEKTIKEFVTKDVVKKTGDGEEDYVIKTKQVLVSEKSRQGYINSFREDVGILNIMKKVALTGDVNLLNQRSGAPEYADLTELPADKMEAFNKVSEGVKAFDELPDDIKQKMSMEMFVKTFGQEQFDNYINAVIAAKEKQEKGGAE